MQQDQQAKENLSTIMKPEFACTDAQKVKQEIQKDVSEAIIVLYRPRRAHKESREHPRLQKSRLFSAFS